MFVLIVFVILMLACFFYMWIKEARNIEQMGGGTNKRLIWWRSFKAYVKEWWITGTDKYIKLGIIFIVLMIVFVLLWNYTAWFDGWSGYVSPRG